MARNSFGTRLGQMLTAIKVQLLQARLRKASGAFASSWNWVDAYLQLVHAEQPALHRMLRQALMARRALLLIDGLDEAGAARTRIEQHVVTALAGDLMLCTSRPTGLDEELFAKFNALFPNETSCRTGFF